MSSERTKQVAEAIRAALRRHNAFVFSDRSTYDALAEAAINALGPPCECQETAGGIA